MNLALGTVQFGVEYGVSNKFGKPGLDAATEIIESARELGVSVLDTAAAYGDSEEILGSIGVADFDVVSKVRPFGEIVPSVNDLLSQLESSLTRLKVSTLYGFMFHRASDLLSLSLDDYQRFVTNCRSTKKVSKVGVSLYSVSELEEILSRGFHIDLVQIPLNLVDRSFLNNGHLSRLKELGVEIHVRSVFMQGLLLMDLNTRPAYFNKWGPLFDKWEKWISQQPGQNKLKASLDFIREIDLIDQIVVGVTSCRELKEIVSNFSEQDKLKNFPNISSDDTKLIHPFNWELM